MRRTAWLGALALALGACAGANTPRQELAYARWARCRAAFVQLERVDLDGRITFLFTDGAAREATLACLAAAGRDGPALPEPRGVRPAGGP